MTTPRHGEIHSRWLAAAGVLGFARDRAGDRRGWAGRARRAGARAGLARAGVPRGPPRPRRLGGGGRRGAAQGAPDDRRGPRRAGLGEADPHHPRRHRRSPRSAPPDQLDGLRTVGPARPAPATGTSAPTSPSRDAKAANEAALADLENGVTSLWLGSTPDADLDTSCSTACCSTWRRWCSTHRRPGGAARAFLAARRRPRAAPGAPTSASTRPSATAEPRPSWPGRRACCGFVVDATEVHDRGASDVQELAHSLAGRRRRTSAR